MKLIVKLALLLGLVFFLANRSDKFEEFIRTPIIIVQGVSTNIELRNLQKLLILHRTANGAYLPEENFADFVQAKIKSATRDPLHDCWKQPYRYRTFKGGFTVLSAGPDGRLNTADDLALTWKE